MAFASRTYTPGSSTTTFALTTSGGSPIGYIQQSDISVTVNGSVQSASSYSFSGTSTVEQPNGGNIVLNAGVTGTVTLTRVTSIQNATVTYTAGSTLTAADLNNADNQIRFGLQEFSDTFAALNTGTGDLEALGGFIGSNEAWASNNTKAATTGAIDARVDSKIDTALTTDVSGGDGVTIVDNSPGSGQIRVDLDADIATLRNMQSGAASALAALTSTELQILDGATLTTTELNYVDGVTSAVQTQLDNKQPIDSELTTLATMVSGTANALKDLTQAEVEILDGATVTTAELNVLDGIPAGLTATELGYVDGVTSAIQTQIDGKQPLDAELTELATMASGTASALADLTQTEVQILDGVTATTAEINYVDGVTSNVQTQLNAKQPLAAPLTTMSSMQSGTASVLASGTALTSSTTELNQLDGKTLGETSLTTNSNTAIPTSKAVADHVAGAVTAVGGFIAIATEVTFPNSQPAADVIVSVSDAGGLSINSSGVVSGATTVGGTGVTITGVPAALYGGAAGNANPNVLAAGEGLQLTSSGSNHSYAYHKILATETDVAQLSGQINDFNERYRYGSQNPTTGLHAGDLFFNTGTGKMLVYDTTGTPGWEEVQSIGNFFISSFTESFDGSRIDFTLSNAPSNAQQVILSINGVVQKPNSGTGRPSEGFSLNGATLQLPTGSGPASGSDYFVIVMGSTVNIGTPSNNTVTSAILQNGSVITAKIGADAVDGSKIADDSINSEHYVDGSIDTAHIADSQITSAKIADGTIATGDIADDAVTTAKISAGAVGASEISPNSIGDSNINASAAIAGSKINPDFGSQDIKTTGTIEVPSINDGQLGNRNMIINGDMQCNQRGNKTGLTSTDYAVDRFKIGITNIGTYSVSQNDNSTDTATTGCRYSLKLDCTTADASPAAADVLSISQSIEGQHMTRLSWGTAGGQKKATLSFWAKADINGFTSGTKDFVVEIQTSTSNEFSVVCQLTANSTWQKFVIVFDAFTAATLVRDNQGAATINWWLAAGSNYKGGTYSSGWQAKNNTSGVRAAGLTLDLSAHTDNNFYLTAVQFELGEKATTFEHKLYQQELSLCQRYYQQLGSTNAGLGGDFAMLPAYTYNVGTRIAATFITNSKMRTTPSIAEIGNGVRVYGQGTNSDIATIFGIATADDTNVVAFTLDGDSSFDWGDSNHAMVVTNKSGGGLSFSAEF